MHGRGRKQARHRARLTTALALQHFQAVAFQSAGLDTVWFELSRIAGLGIVFFAASMVLFLRSMSVSS